ncbi:dihydrolipoyllysine-residue acetyltransferase [Pokkaliibacter sp. MBI-7]|uniref:dihydrolipoyllysine-residue acetyltransferase n=1 Tax=Pokkaliibacter sp. MBI-7 TaxID=3040600 RepID=UPI002447BAFA|nr:dihydrolipoyllysine-residue acetyltransferase [Pokkaliibacter sp. MBI-7]MDH2436181.1 dihydrolipoyllysine-residue acetyltransferase [Pokkaliibacter sp. MBI-7]
MQIDFILPDIGEGIVECELVEWLVHEGDVIEEDQPVADVMTDKALVQIPAMHSGTVTRLYYQQGEIAKVHAPLFALDIADAAEQAANDPAPIATSTTPATVNGASRIKDFILPDIGEGIVETELVEWLVKEGDLVEEDQPVADVMTDKALVQIPAMDSGRIVRLYYQQGDIARVHSPLYAIEVSGEHPPHVHTIAQLKPQTSVTSSTAAQPAALHGAPAGQGKALASPAVRRIAREMSLDLSRVTGSGKNGRVLKEDLLRLQQAPAASPAPVGTTTSSATQTSQPVEAPVSQAPVSQAAVSPAKAAAPAADQGENRIEPIRGIRAAMARQMQDSVSTIPHFTYSEELDITALDNLRQQMKARFEKDGVKLTMMPFFMKALALSIEAFPILNSRVNPDCTELTYLGDINIGMAVDTPVGLMVPNIKQVQRRSLREIAEEVGRLTQAARAGRVSQDDLKGGTITISNVGAIGGIVATPIINKPEVAIVALGRVQTLPRFNDQGQVEARKIIHISWSGDHRVIDGATMARFCNQWKSYLEDPVSMLSYLR